MQKNNLPYVEDCPDLKGKTVVLRSALNVPIENGEVKDDFRIIKSLDTVSFLQKKGAKVVILAHVGRDPETSLVCICQELKKHIDIEWAGGLLGEEVKNKVNELEEGQVLMLENVRSHEGEKTNDDSFAEQLSQYGDIFINDAFADSHREHASIVGVPKYLPSYVGFSFYQEYNELNKFHAPDSPSLFILGGSKFETKQPLVEKFSESYTNIFIGGALANDFFKAQGYEVGNSTVSDIDLNKSSVLNQGNILLSVDVVVEKDGSTRVGKPDSVMADERIVDVGPETISMLSSYIREAKMVLWNGPIGYYEKGYGDQTESCARIIAKSEGFSVVGGGDTVTALRKLELMDDFTFVSTAGGAMLQFLEKQTLSGIEAILKK